MVISGVLLCALFVAGYFYSSQYTSRKNLVDPFKPDILKINALSELDLIEVPVPSFVNLDSANVKMLFPNILNYMSISQFNAVQSGLSLAQIQKLDAKHIPWLNGNVFDKFTSEEKAKIPGDFLCKMSAKQIEILGKFLSLEQLKSLRPDQIKMLPLRRLSWLSPEEIKSLSPSFLNCLKENQLKVLERFLTQEQLISLSPEIFKTLTDEAIGSLTPDFIQKLSPDQLNTFPPDKIKPLLRFLNFKQICGLKEMLYSFIGDNCLLALSHEEVKQLAASGKMKHLNEHQTELIKKYIAG